MNKFNLFSVKCKMCGFKTELSPEELNSNPFCEKCGSTNLKIDKKTLHMLKKGGKFVTDIGFSVDDDIFDVTPVNEMHEQKEEPLLILKKDEIKISENIDNNDLKQLLGKMNVVRNKILDRIEVDREELVKKLF